MELKLTVFLVYGLLSASVAWQSVTLKAGESARATEPPPRPKLATPPIASTRPSEKMRPTPDLHLRNIFEFLLTPRLALEGEVKPGTDVPREGSGGWLVKGRTVRARSGGQAFVERVEDRLGAVVDPELRIHQAGLVPDRLLGHAQLARDLIELQPKRHQPQDLELTGRQPGRWLLLLGSAEGGGDDRTLAVMAQHMPALRSSHDRFDKTVATRVLEHVTPRACSQRFDHGAVRPDGREHEHAHSRMLGRDAGGGSNAVKPGHLDVHQHNVRKQGGDFAQRNYSVFGLPDDGHAILGLEQLDQAFAEERLVIHHQYANRRRPGTPSAHEIGTSTRISVPG